MDPLREQLEIMTRRHFFGALRELVSARWPWPACWRRTPGPEALPTRSNRVLRRGLRPAACRVCRILLPRRSGPSTCS